LTHQIDNYNTFVTVLGTAYYTACIGTHVGQVQQKPIHACCNADECIRIKALLYGGPTVSCAHNGTVGTLTEGLHALIRTSVGAYSVSYCRTSTRA